MQTRCSPLFSHRRPVRGEPGPQAMPAAPDTDLAQKLWNEVLVSVAKGTLGKVLEKPPGDLEINMLRRGVESCLPGSLGYAL